MTYGFNDAKQAALGSVVAVLFFYLLRAGEPIMIDPKKGLLIGAIWLFITSKPFITKKRETKVHGLSNIAIALVITTILSVAFDMVTLEQIQSFQFFGTAAWLGLLLAIPSAQFFDKMNISNIYDRWYFRKR